MKQLRYVLKSFPELSTLELHVILKLRAEVFVLEQNSVYVDPDDKDLDALHLCGYDEQQLCAYARVYLKSKEKAEAAIGRVVVHPTARGAGSGRSLMEQAIQTTQKTFPGMDIVISAQHYLEVFYTSLGFITESAMYLEDGIPHLRMRRKAEH